MRLLLCLMIVACSGRPALTPDECDKEIALIGTKCTADILLCKTAECVEDTREKCHQLKEEACK